MSLEPADVSPESPTWSDLRQAMVAEYPPDTGSRPIVYRVRRRVLLPVVLFVVTCFSTFWAGACGNDDTLRIFAPLTGPAGVWTVLADHWSDGLAYMLGVMSILMAHEMGHFLQAVRYHIPASLPYFVPMPLTPIGTMGAVIGMQGSKANRKELFDIGLTGPLAGLAVAIPIVIYGVMTARVTTEAPIFQDPLLVRWLVSMVRPDVEPGQFLEFNPLYLAGWVGMLITGLNMLPVGQLDGGHVAYALWGRWAHLLARAIILAAVVFMLIEQQITWVLMIGLIMLMGTDHPPTADDHIQLGWERRVLGMLSLLIPVVCFAPIPIRVM